jgi:hypothetical protein
LERVLPESNPPILETTFFPPTKVIVSLPFRYELILLEKCLTPLFLSTQCAISVLVEESDITPGAVPISSTVMGAILEEALLAKFLVLMGVTVLFKFEPDVKTGLLLSIKSLLILFPPKFEPVLFLNVMSSFVLSSSRLRLFFMNDLELKLPDTPLIDLPGPLLELIKLCDRLDRVLLRVEFVKPDRPLKLVLLLPENPELKLF